MRWEPPVGPISSYLNKVKNVRDNHQQPLPLLTCRGLYVREAIDQRQINRFWKGVEKGSGCLKKCIKHEKIHFPENTPGSSYSTQQYCMYT